jgi:hypothetical protein
MLKHGAPASFLGVSIADLKKIQKRVKTDHAFALALYDTGIGDAQYLAVYVCDPSKFTKAQLQKWVKNASWHMVSEYAVAWATAESPFAAELAREWIDSPKESIASTGWSAYSSLVTIKDDDQLDLDEIVELLDRVQNQIDKAPNRVRYLMNGFVIAVGSAVIPVAAKAKAVAKVIGEVHCEMVGACKVPLATEYIAKVEKAGKAGKKRKSAMC